MIKPVILLSSFSGLVLIAVLMAITSPATIAAKEAAKNSAVIVAENIAASAQHPVSVEERVTQLVQVHCTNCHAAVPTQPGFSAAPAGLIIGSTAQLAAQKVRALPALTSGYMPLGNFHQLTDLERKTLIDWLAQQ